MELTQEWIAQYNKKCAEFLGVLYGIRQNGKVKEESKVRIHKILNLDETEGLHINHCKFHSDWNWIMEVCFKISSLSSDDTFEGLNGRVFRFKHSMFWEVIEDKNKFLLKIEEFIDWYNKQKES